MSPNLKETAQSSGWWNGTEEFNFSKVFGLGDKPELRETAGREMLEKYSADGKIYTNSIIKIKKITLFL